MLVLQQEIAECGLACLAMILRKHGSCVDIETLRHKFEISIRGTSVAELVKMAQSLYLKTTVYFLKPEQVNTLICPVILHWNSNHYVVLDKIDSKKGYHILDPALGKYWISKQDLTKYFSYFAIALQPNEKFTVVKKKSFYLYREIIKKIPRFFSQTAFITLATLIIQMLILLFPSYIQRLIDPSILAFDWGNWLKLSALILILFKISEAIMHLLRAINIGRLEKAITEHLGLKVFNHLMQLPLSFFEKRLQSTISSRFNSIDKMREILSRGLAEGLIDGICSVFILIVIFSYSVKIGTILSFFTLGYLSLNFLFSSTAQSFNQIQIKERTKEYSFFMECLRGVIPIKIFSREDHCIKKWFNLYQKFLSTSNKINLLQALLESSRIILFGLQMIILLLVGLRLVHLGQLTIGQLCALLFYINALTKNISGIANKWFDTKLFSTHASYLGDILSCPRETLPQTKSLNNDAIYQVKMENICFRYHENEPWILKNVNLSFGSGECIMLIGPSGQGKSTLLKILMGLLQPTIGKIYINNIPLERNNIQSYRSKISAVMQNDDLFCGTIYDNIGFFAEHMDYKKVQTCAKLAGIAEEIEAMPMAYNSYLGDMGIAISGGQKQRILLARALYSNPSILFLDEAFSNLDIEKEKALSYSLSKLGITQFIVTHRLGSLNMADKVIDIRQSSSETNLIPSKIDGLSNQL